MVTESYDSLQNGKDTPIIMICGKSCDLQLTPKWVGKILCNGAVHSIPQGFNLVPCHRGRGRVTGREVLQQQQRRT